jgi:hypothetical protein
LKTISAKPRIRKIGQLYANIGDTKNITCSASGKNVTLKWFTNQFDLIPCDDLVNEQKYSCVDGGNHSTLIYRNVSEARTFTCIAHNAAGNDALDFKLELTKAPVIVKNEDRIMRVVAGTKLELTCEATGIPSVEWIWYHNRNPILGVTDTFFVNSSDSNISILSAKNAQAGNYSCEATNSVSSDESDQTEVILVEVPRLPDIECDEDSRLPNRAICEASFDGVTRERLPTKYHIELTIMDGALLTYNSIVEVPYTGKSHFIKNANIILGNVITVRPLNTSTEYRARFKVVNEAGESNWSDPEILMTSEPSAPESTSDINWNCDEIKCTFRWAPADDNGRPITGYNVQVSRPNNTENFVSQNKKIRK